MLPTTNLSKRPSASRNPPSKRKKMNDRNFSANIIVNHDYSNMDDNAVFLSKKLYNEIFPAYASDHYLKVGQFVYKARVKGEIENDNIEINHFQSLDLDECISYDTLNNQTIKIKRFDTEQNHRHSNIKNIFITLKAKGSFLKGSVSKITKIDVKLLENFIIRKFSSQFFLHDQKFLIDSPQGMFEATVDSIKKISNLKNIIWGRIFSETKVNFKCDSSKIALVKKIHDIDSNAKVIRYFLRTSKLIRASMNSINDGFQVNENAWKESVAPIPLHVSFPLMVDEIKDAFKGKDVCVKDKKKIRISDDWIIVVKFQRALLQNNMDISNQFDYKISFPFDPNIHLSVQRISDIIFTHPEENAKKAAKLEFQIINFEPNDVNVKQWINVENLISHIKDSYTSLPKNGKMTVELDGKVILLKLVDVFGIEGRIYENTSNLQDIWALSPTTTIKINKASSLKCKLIDNEIIHKLSKLKVKIERVKIGEKSDKKTLVLDEEEMKEKLLSLLPKEIFSKHKLKSTLFSGENIIFHLEEFHYANKDQITYEHGLRFTCTDETEIAFETKENTGIIFSSSNTESVKDLEKKLLDLGIGGLPEGAISFVRSIILSRGPCRDTYKKHGIHPERGALFYGPPGTGKTLLARNIGILLGIAKENTNLITGSSIWNKYVGESEKNIRELFVNARSDQEKYGDKSPLHLLIIDEIDSILTKRDSDNQRWETSTVNAFLGELDGVNGQLKNMVVIGLTNQKELLDEAVLRAGRLGRHIYIGLPDAAGRKEILDIYTKKFIEEKSLDKDVYLSIIDKLVTKTVRKSGAFLEQLIQETTKIAIKKLYDKIEANPQANDSLEIVAEDIFLAFQKIVNKDNAPTISYIEKDPLSLDDFSDSLKKLGVIGLDNQAINTLKDILLSKVLNKNRLKNIQSPRGLFLCGPKRIGKTKLAESLKDLYQVEEDHFHYHNFSSLWQLHDQNLKREIQKIFEPIYQTSKDLNEQSPLFLIVLDNIDYLFSTTILNKMDPHACMNEFFNELDSLFKDLNKPNNMLVVFTTSYDRHLDPKIIKYGAQGSFIELKLPSLDKRKEVFEYYLEPLHAGDACDKNIDIQRLALLTEQKNAEFIESVVSRARDYYLRDANKINTDDLIKAIQELDAEPQWAKNVYC